MILTEFSPCTPESTSSTLSRMTCEKFQLTPGSASFSSALISWISSALVRGRSPRNQASPAGLGDGGRPILERLQGHEKLGAVEAGRIDARIGPAELADDQLDFGILAHDRAGQPRFFGVLLQRNADRENAANPKMALFQGRHEFASQERQRGQPLPTISAAKPPSANAR